MGTVSNTSKFVETDPRPAILSENITQAKTDALQSLLNHDPSLMAIRVRETISDPKGILGLNQVDLVYWRMIKGKVGTPKATLRQFLTKRGNIPQDGEFLLYVDHYLLPIWKYFFKHEDLFFRKRSDTIGGWHISRENLHNALWLILCCEDFGISSGNLEIKLNRK